MTRQPYIADYRRPMGWIVVAIFGLLALACPLVCAQAASQPAPVEIKVSQATRGGKLINVPVNKGVLVDFSVPVKEVRMSNPDIADVAVTGPRQILVSGKTFGATQLVTWVDGDHQQTVFDVAVDIDLDRLQASIRSTAPRARVQATSVLDTVVLSGTVPDAETAEHIMEIAGIYSKQVVNQMRVAGVQQVLLRCTVAEVNRSATRQLGFNGWMAGNNFKDMFAVSQLDGINPVNIGAAANARADLRIPFLTDQNGLPLSAQPTLSLGFPNVQMQLFVQALRENGLLKVLAEPNLVAVSGQEATFLAGGEFPVPVPQGGQNNSITIEYREFGVRLHFTPVVLGNNVIRLKVSPEVSEPDYSSAVTLSGFVVPGLVQRRVDTTVELGPGQTFAIGGLLSERARAVSKKVPALGDVPVVGALFSSVQYQSDETELVVLVTPELVEPLNPDQIPYVPGGKMVPPNDAELFLFGAIEGQPAHSERSCAAASETCARGGPANGTALSKLRGPVGPAGAEEGG